MSVKIKYSIIQVYRSLAVKKEGLPAYLWGGFFLIKKYKIFDFLEGKEMKKIVLALMVLCSFADVYPVTIDYFNDGQHHSIDYYIIQHAKILNNAVNVATSVDLLSNGTICEDLAIYGTSILNNYGGSIGRDFYAYNNSQTNIHSGSIGRDLLAYGYSNIVFGNGSVTRVAKLFNYSSLNIVNGSFQDIYAYNSSNINFDGGYVHGNLIACDDSKIYISGGYFGGQLQSIINGEVVIYGTNFNYNYGYVTDAFGVITGQLLNGDIVSIDFMKANNGQILLVPEPMTLALLGLGGLFLRRKNR